jgi:acyl-CoA thioester hydrolase
MWKATPVAHFSKRIEIRWRDLDGFAHVNNSTYLTYLEEARDEFFTGLLGETVHRVVVRRIEIDFRSPLVQEDDHAVVELALVAIGRSSATTREVIRSAVDFRVAAEAQTVVVHTDAARAASEAWDGVARAALEARSAAMSPAQTRPARPA